MKLFLLGVAEGAEEDEEIGVGFLAEEFVAVVFGLFAFAAAEEGAALGKGGDVGDGADAAEFARGEEHAGVAGVDGEGEHAAADGRDFAGDGVERRRDRGGDLRRGRRDFGSGGSSQRNAGRVVDAAGFQGQDDFGEVEALDLGEFLGGAVGVLAFRPEADAEAGGGAAGAARALVGGGAADFFDEQGVDAAIGIEAGDAGQAGCR